VDSVLEEVKRLRQMSQSQPTKEKAMTKPETNYTFWIETKTGEEIYWDGLTKRQAEAMYAATLKSDPLSLKRWGWGAVEESKLTYLPLTGETA
jgi:hypothetical protein